MTTEPWGLKLPRPGRKWAGAFLIMRNDLISVEGLRINVRETP